MRRSIVPVTMASGWPVRVRPQRGRRASVTGLIVLGLVLVGLFAVSAGLGQASGSSRPDADGPDRSPSHELRALGPSRPVRLVIQAIGVRAPVREVGLAADGSMDKPPLARPDQVGWFDHGPTPGQLGPAVLVGYAIARSGPSVFVDLGKLKPGQLIEVIRRDRRVAVFEVSSVERFATPDLPVARVHGGKARPTLRLITWGGPWLGGSVGYADTIIVFASLVATRRA